MSTREEFEKWWNELNSGRTKFLSVAEAWLAWQARQPEIDKLQKDVETMEQAYLGEVDVRIKAENEIDQLRARVAELEFGAKSVLQMLLTEQNTKSALFKAEDMLRAVLAAAPEVDRG